MRSFFVGMILTVVTAIPAGAAQIVVNGDFETGFLAPWVNAAHFCGNGCDDWITTSSTSHSGTFSAFTDDNIEIFQAVTPTLTSDITAASYWIKQPDGGGVSFFRFFYSDATTSSNTPSIGTDWTFINQLGLLTPGKTLVGLGLFGVTNGQTPGLRTFLDDVSIETRVAAVPEPGSLLLIGSGFVALVARRKQSANRR